MKRPLGICMVISREDMAHPRRAARDTLKGAALAVRQSRPGGALGWTSPRFDVTIFLRRPLGGHP